MSLKRVNPTDVQAYGTAAQGYFDSIFTSLTTLCDNVVSVHYFGTNAYQFKYDAGELAEAFARSMAPTWATSPTAFARRRATSPAHSVGRRSASASAASRSTRRRRNPTRGSRRSIRRRSPT